MTYEKLTFREAVKITWNDLDETDLISFAVVLLIYLIYMFGF